MEINKTTKILPIIDKYPRVYEELYKISSKIKKLKNPIARKTIGKKISLEIVSGMLKIPLEKLISVIKTTIEMSGAEKPGKDRKEMLKKLLLDMHKGVNIEILKTQFKEAVGYI